MFKFGIFNPNIFPRFGSIQLFLTQVMKINLVFLALNVDIKNDFGLVRIISNQVPFQFFDFSFFPCPENDYRLHFHVFLFYSHL